jgi:hypothetical protein
MPNNFLEKTLEDIIFDNREYIHEKGLPRFKNQAFRQFFLPSGRKIDIITFDLLHGSLDVHIYELKKEYIDAAAICQAYNYLHEFMGLTAGNFESYNVKVIMIGKKYEPVSLLDGLKADIDVYTYDYGMNGIEFQKQNSGISYTAANDVFSTALWAWGMHMLHYPEGQPSTVNIYTGYLRHIADNPEYDAEVKNRRDRYYKPVLMLPEPDNSLRLSPTTLTDADSTKYLPIYDDENPDYIKSSVED